MNINPLPGGHYQVTRTPAGWGVVQVSPNDPARRLQVFRGTKEEAHKWVEDHQETHDSIKR